MSATIDLWETAKDEGRDRFEDEYYITHYNPRLHRLYIQMPFYRKKENHAALVKAFHKAQTLTGTDSFPNTHEVYFFTKKSPGAGEPIRKEEDIEAFRKLLTPIKKTKKTVFVAQPGDYDENAEGLVLKSYPRGVGIRKTESPESAGGAAAAIFKKTTMKKQVAGRERVIYLGAQRRHYVKIKGAFVAVRDVA